MNGGWTPLTGRWKQRAILLLPLLLYVLTAGTSFGLQGLLVTLGVIALIAILIVTMTASYYREQRRIREQNPPPPMPPTPRENQ